MREKVALLTPPLQSSIIQRGKAHSLIFAPRLASIKKRIIRFSQTHLSRAR